MKRNGMYALDFHGPALVEGNLTYLRGTRYVNKVVALCFLSYAGMLSAGDIDRQAARFEEVGATLLIANSGARPLHRLWIGQLDKPNTPILADIGGRLRQSFGVVAATERSAHCYTFMIDRQGILRLRVTYDFVENDLETLREIVVLTDIYGGNAEFDRGAPTNKAEYMSV